MMQGQTDFLAALRRGDRAALETFYEQLRSQSDDQAFWRFLEGQLPTPSAGEPCGDVASLRRAIGTDFGGFLRSAPVAAVMAFLALAMLTACEPNPGAEATPPDETAAAVTPADAGPTTAAPEPAPPAEAAAPALTPEELRARLLEYIVKAQLPASEKRRLKTVLKKTEDPQLVESQTQLTELFAKESPKEIAATLEAMVLFQARTGKTPGKGKHPARVTRYKGVNFGEELAPPMTTLYKGVRFPRA